MERILNMKDTELTNKQIIFVTCIGIGGIVFMQANALYHGHNGIMTGAICGSIAVIIGYLFGRYRKKKLDKDTIIKLANERETKIE